MNENHVTDLLAAYALGALDPEEKQAVSKHLSQCDSCQGEWQSYQETTALLAWSVPQIDPPEKIKQKILKTAQQSTASKMPLARTRLFDWFYRSAPALSFVFLVAIIGLLISILLLWQQVRQADLREQAAMQQVASFRMLSNDYQVVHLTSMDNMSHASGVLVFTQDGMSGALIVNGLPVLDNNHQYQLWLNKNGMRTSGGVFNVGQDGYNLVEVGQAPLAFNSYSSFGITIEPYGGSPSPTGKKVLGGNF